MAHHLREFTFGWLQLHENMDPSHELVRLAGKIDWEGISEALRVYYKPLGRKHLPIRLMVGLHILKHRYNLSDAKAVGFLRENFYWMYFCDVSPDWVCGAGQKALERSSMSRFRGRIGDRGVALIEGVLRDQLISEGLLNPRMMTVDSTAMEKHVEYPTDSGLLDRGRKKLVGVVRGLIKQGVRPLKQFRTYAKKGKRAVLGIIKLGKDRKERIKRNSLELARYARHLLTQTKAMLGRAGRKLRRAKARLDFLSEQKLRGAIAEGQRLVGQVGKVIRQTRERFKGHHLPRKLYSYHEPQVTVIRKGKRSKPDEYGCKVNFSFDRHGFVVGHEEYTTNRHDAKLLDPALRDWQEKTGRLPSQLNIDRGYRQKKGGRRYQGVDRVCIPPAGSAWDADHGKGWHRLGRGLRAGSEAIIGHLKQDHRLDRSRYQGFRGDKINVGWATIAWNTKKWMRITV